MSPRVLAVLAAAALVPTLSDTLTQCPGNLNLEGFGLTSIVPTGWANPQPFVPPHVSSTGDEIAAELNSRAYFAESCNGVYDHNQYLALNLLGKRMRYTTDMSDSGCGCNAALYLTSMHQNSHPSECSDYYCDANNVCGESCAEIDIQEANKFAWLSTLHGSHDKTGVGGGAGGGGAGWNGPRDWSTWEYGPGASCIDTSKPFQVEVGFPADANCQLEGMHITLSQKTRSDCELKLDIHSYCAMPEMTNALAAGMTPIVSYWNSNDMLWLDGKGADGRGACARDSPESCGKKTKFSNFSVAAIPGTACKAKLTDQQPAKPNLLVTEAPDVLLTDATAKESTTIMPTTTMTMTTMTMTTTTTTLLTSTFLADRGAGSFDVPVGMVRTLGFSFVAGALSMSIVFVVVAFVRSRLSQKMKQTLPSSNSLVSMSSARELAQQQA